MDAKPTLADVAGADLEIFSAFAAEAYLATGGDQEKFHRLMRAADALAAKCMEHGYQVAADQCEDAIADLQPPF